MSRVLIAVATAIALAGAIPAAADPVQPAHPAPGSAPVTVEAGATTSGVNLQLSVGTAKISGRILDAQSGQPIMGEAVEAFGNRHSPDGGSSDFTDADGRFTLDELRASGQGYYVCAYELTDVGDPTRYAPQCFASSYWAPHGSDAAVPADATQFPIADGGDVDAGDMSLTPGGRIQGRVTAPSGKKIGQVTVTARSLGDPSFVYGSSGGTDRRTGQYFVGGLPPLPDGWQICFNGRFGYTDDYSAGHGFLDACTNTPEVGAGQVRKGVDETLQHAGAITGTVHRASDATTKTLYHLPVAAYGRSGHLLEWTVTEKHGHFTLAHMKAHRLVTVCALRAYADSSAGAAKSCAAHTVHTQPAETVRGVSIAFRAAASISGALVGANGKPARQVGIRVFNTAGKAFVPYQQALMTDDRGRFHIIGLGASKRGFIVCADPKSFITSASGAPSCYRSTPWDGSKDVDTSAAHPIVMKHQQHRHGIDFTLLRSGTITGHVSSQVDGTPEDTGVFVYNHHGDYVTDVESRSADGTVGNYTVRGLTPGDYFVCAKGDGATPHADPTRPSFFDGQCHDQAFWPH